MGKILLENISLYAFHGAIPEENKIGSKYLINVEIDVDMDAASKSDKLEDTFNYALAYSILREEMKKPSKLLEHVAGRILDRILLASPKVNSAQIKLSKLNPPFGGNVKAVSIALKKDQK